jgi:GDP-4-dehydro-6-deoxy-D-mannose reductase
VIVLVTGAGGFLGRHVVRALRRELTGASIHGLDLPGVRQPEDALDAAHACDLGDAEAAGRALAAVRAEVVVHLAGLIQSRDRDALHRANVTGTENLLAALSTAPARVVLIGSSAVYGAPDRLPVVEASPLRPATSYGETMLLREEAARRRAARDGTALAILRLFNLCGPGQAPSMMLPAWARQLARIEAGRQEPTLTVGRLDTRRELIDVRDVAVAVAAAATCPDAGLAGVLNVCTGVSIRGAEVLERLLDLATVRPRVEQVAQEGRAADVPDLRGDPAAIRRALGWSPRLALETTLRDVLDDWRARERDRDAP